MISEKKKEKANKKLVHAKKEKKTTSTIKITVEIAELPKYMVVAWTWNNNSFFRFNNQTRDYDEQILNPNPGSEYSFRSFGYQPPFSLYAPTHYGNYTLVLRATTQNGLGKGIASIFTTRSPEGRK